jgi:predicted kinase
LIRGLPGSGKSSLAKEFVVNGYRHIEADMYFYVHGRYIFKRTFLERAHTWCLSATRLALDRGESVVVSNVFSRLSEMTPYLKLSDSHVVVELTGTQANTHRVSESAISTMRQRWQPLPS